MTRRKAPMIAVLVVLVLVAALLGGELYVRQQIKSCLAGQLENELGSEVEVGLGWKPIKQVSSVTLDSNDARFGPAVDMTVSAEVEDVDLEQSAESGGTIGSSNADIAWSTEGIAATLQSQGIGGLVSDVTSDASTGTLSFAIGGLAQLTVEPTVAGDRVDVRTVDASILGLGIPTDLVDSIVGILSDSLQQYPLDMTPTSLTVTDTGIELQLEGGAYVIPPRQADQTVEAPEGCGLLA